VKYALLFRLVQEPGQLFFSLKISIVRIFCVQAEIGISIFPPVSSIGYRRFYFQIPKNLRWHKTAPQVFCFLVRFSNQLHGFQSV